MSSCHTSRLTNSKGQKNYPPHRETNWQVGCHAEPLSSEYLKGRVVLPDGLLAKWGDKTGLGQQSSKQNLGIWPEAWLELASSDKCPLGLASSLLLWGAHLENMSNSLPPPPSWGPDSSVVLAVVAVCPAVKHYPITACAWGWGTLSFMWIYIISF